MADAIKKALPYFFAGFFVFLVLGVYSGWDRRKEVARNKIYAAIMGDRDDNGYFLVHVCKEKRSHRFYVEENRVESDVVSSALRAGEFRHGPPSERHLKHRELIVGLLGGVSGGMTYKDIARARQSTLSRTALLTRVVAGIVGGISGYTLGYWAGSRYDVDCDSALARELLTDSKEWKQMETELVYFSISESEAGDRPLFWKDTGRNVSPLDDDPIVLCETSLGKEFSVLKKQAERVNADFGDRAFAALYQLADRYKAAIKTKEYEDIKRMNRGRLARGQATLEAHYGYSPERWQSTCAKLEASIQQFEPR